MAILFYAAPEGLTIEDLTTFTEVDQNSDITITSSKCNFVSLDRVAVSYVYKDYGVGDFGEFDIDFEFYIQEGASEGAAILFAVSNITGTMADMITASDGITMYAYMNTNNLRTEIRDWSQGAGAILHTFGGGTTTSVVYATATRVGTTFTVSLFSDSDRLISIGSNNVTCETETKRYLSVLASRDSAADGADAITGYTQNVIIN